MVVALCNCMALKIYPSRDHSLFFSGSFWYFTSASIAFLILLEKTVRKTHFEETLNPLFWLILTTASCFSPMDLNKKK